MTLRPAARLGRVTARRATRARRLAATGAVWIALVSTTAPASAQSSGEKGVSISVYGTIVANAGRSSSQLAVPDIPLWALTGALTPPPVAGETLPSVNADDGSFEMTARQTRLGARISRGGQAGEWTAAGQIEIDFLGARPAAPQGAVFNQPRLRLAFAMLSHESGWRIVAGQDWVPFAPLNPLSFSHFAIPLAASGGNPWSRLPQFRVERTFASDSSSDGLSVLVQGAVLSPVGAGDSPAAGTLADSPSLAGARSGQPFYQARLAVTGRSGGASPALGVSGHYGRERPDSGALPSWGVALDGTWLASSRISVSGELWHGANLDTFQAGIAQGLARRGGSFHVIRATGGWLQATATLPHGWRVSGGFAEDDPRDTDLTTAASRSRNGVAWAAAMYELHPGATLAAQYTRFSTTYLGVRGVSTDAARGHHLNVALALAF